MMNIYYNIVFNLPSKTQCTIDSIWKLRVNKQTHRNSNSISTHTHTVGTMEIIFFNDTNHDIVICGIHSC